MASFQKTLARLKEVTAELRAIDDSSNRKLTAERFLAEALERSSAPLDELLDRWKKADRLQSAQIAVRALMRWLVAGDGGMKITRTPNDRALGGMIRSEPAIAEAASVGLTSWDLWTIAVAKAKNQHPDTFGPVDDPNAYEAKVAKLEDEFSDLCDQLETAWTVKDVTIEPVGHNLCKLQFKDVPVFVQEDNGKRLGAYLRQNG